MVLSRSHPALVSINLRPCPVRVHFQNGMRGWPDAASDFFMNDACDILFRRALKILNHFTLLLRVTLALGRRDSSAASKIFVKVSNLGVLFHSQLVESA